MTFRHNHTCIIVVVEKSIVDVEVMELVKDKVVAMIDPNVFDTEMMGVVGKLNHLKPLLKVVLPKDLVDNESIELIDDLVPVWIDLSSVEFNPATMTKVSWNADEPIMHKSENQMIGNRQVYEDIYNTITIENDSSVEGDIYGCVTIRAGIKVVVEGDIYGTVKMEKNSDLTVEGDVYGVVSNKAGTVSVYGDVYGAVNSTQGGQAFLEDKGNCEDNEDENVDEDEKDENDRINQAQIKDKE